MEERMIVRTGGLGAEMQEEQQHGVREDVQEGRVAEVEDFVDEREGENVWGRGDRGA